ncbi:putative polyketide synthase [Xylaria palmicola]|nr:putative polyketide synthase [Xylaria palmicola]
MCDIRSLAHQVSMPRQSSEPIAIIGSACRFAGSTSSPQKLWEILSYPRDLQQEIPNARFNAKGFYHHSGTYHGHSNVKHGYFLDEDPTAFDTEFFSIRAAEAEAMDPQQRMLLEVVYEGLESAGLPVTDLRGSDTAVYVGSMTDDYANMLLRDIQDTPTYYATGAARSVLSNRVSYVFDWHGPSISIDTACSSSLVAVHMALQALRAGDAQIALACGTNLILGPESFIVESKLGMLSPDGRGRMWDQGANGYARGEGVAVLVLKTLSAAVEDGDHVECIIRETGLNQDGNTAGITMPSANAQAALIRNTYVRAGLDLRDHRDHPQFFEAHGTGTLAGDKAEAQAIHSVFITPNNGDECESGKPPLFVGSIKTVLGHTEGTAGIAAILKASLAIQNKTVPSNLLFERLSDQVAPFYKGIEIPRISRPWPDYTGERRRASVNSFGFGGTNAHAILESFDSPQKETEIKGPIFTPFLFSAVSQVSLIAMLRNYAEYLGDGATDINIHDLAWTLRRRRSGLTWRTAIVASSAEDLKNQICTILENHDTSPGIRALPPTQQRILGIFTGQGAQYVGMGFELFHSSGAARGIMEKLESYLKEIPAGEAPVWSLSAELQARSPVGINKAAISQPLCTAIQILLVDLLRLGGVHFEAVIGHSSGEIAAAYAAGFISARDAMLISYYRGVHLSRASSPNGPDIQGAMVAVGTSFADAIELCGDKAFRGRIVVAAFNSPASVTISGDEDAIAELEDILQDEGKFYRRLHVDRAYHSPHMLPCFDPYVASLRRYVMGIPRLDSGKCAWFSSVHGGLVEAAESIGLGGVYWAKNLTRPVLFSQAITTALVTRPCDLVVEIGPHPALKYATKSAIQNTIGKELPYHESLIRKKDAAAALSSVFGYLWTHLSPPNIDIDAYERAMRGGGVAHRVLKGLPSYPWRHDTKYWYESRASRKIRTREERIHPLLGHFSVDSAPHHLIWKHLFRVSEMSWISGHLVQGQLVFPAAGYVCVAVEAARHLAPGQGIRLIELRDLMIHRAIVFDHNDRGIDVLVSLEDVSKQSPNGVKARFTLSAAIELQRSDDLVLVADCLVEIKSGEANPSLLCARRDDPPHMLDVETERFYSALGELGYQFSGRFRALSSMRRKHLQSSSIVAATATKEQDDGDDGELLIHPAEVDASLQSIMLAHSYPYDGSLTNVYLPTMIQHIMVNPAICKTDNKTIQAAPIAMNATVLQRNNGERGIRGHTNIYTGTSQHAAIQIQGAIFMPLGGSTSGQERKVFSKVRWIPSQPDGLLAARNIPLPHAQGVTIELLERIAIFYLREFNRQLPVDSPIRFELPTSAYLSFAQHVTDVVASGRHKIARVEWLHDTQEDILDASRPFLRFPDVQIMHLVGTKMPFVLAGEGDMLEHFRAEGNDILDRYYADALGLKQSAQWVGRCIKQITDRHRKMNILEIGAGTGAATKAILKEIGQNFSSYTYTDISAAFFQNASSTFSGYKDRMVFRKLNLEKDPVETGFTESSYDLVVCFFVLHATSDISRCLRNIRKLLRPGGYLVIGEGQDAWEGAATMGFTFGTLPGWWIGANDGRILSPYVLPQHWDSILKNAGFSGIDTAPPPEFQESYSVFHFVTQAVDDYIEFLREPLASRSTPVALIPNLVIVGGHTAGTSSLVISLKGLIANLSPMTKCYTFGTLLEVDYSLIDGNTTVLSLTELDFSFFKDLTPDHFTALKAMLQTGKTLLWVTSGRLEKDPHSNMTVGFGRVAANEAPDLRLQQLDIADSASVRPETILEILLRFHAGDKANGSILWTVETEIVLDKNGREMIPRIEHIKELNDRYNSKTHTVVRETDIEASPVSIILRPEKESYIVQELPRPPLQSASIDALIELRTDYSTLLAIWTTVGPRHLFFGTDPGAGEKFVGLVPSPVSNVFRVSKDSVVPLPSLPNVSMSHYLSTLASHLIVAGVIDRLYSGQMLVVHNVPRIIVQAFHRQAAAKGILVIYTTDLTGNDIPTSWVRLPPYLTEADIEISLLPAKMSMFVGFSYEGTQSFDNEKKLIKYLEGRCHSFITTNRLCSLTASDVGPVPAGIVSSILRRTMEAVAQVMGEQEIDKLASPSIRLEALVNSVHPRNLLTAVEWATTAPLPVHVTRLDSKPMFRGNGSTYWIIGMSRALGISLADWLISKGVVNLVITSRDPNIDQRWIASHKHRGITIAVVPCDITNESGLKSAYRDICALLPPVVGVIQGAMVLHDTLLCNMTFQQFQDVAGPKVDGSMHLDRLFSNNDLDFFVLVSSINCIIGNVGQANYASANAFMCGLAAQRRARGLPSAAVNIGAIIGPGYMMRESRKELDNIVERYFMLRMSEEDWCQAISEAIDACRLDSLHGPELITGLPDIVFDIANAPNAPNWCTNPTFSPLIVSGSGELDITKEQEEVLMTTSERLHRCRTQEEISQVVEEAFAIQLRQVLRVSASNDELMASRSRDIGLDSLVSVDIRSWFLKTLRVNVPVLVIMGNNTMSYLAQYAIEGLSRELAPGVGGSQDQVHVSQKSDTGMNKIAQLTNTYAIDWRAESCPLADAAISAPGLSAQLPVRSPARIIVLTGCTGLLGHHLLSQLLLAEPPVEKVICIAIRSLEARIEQGKLLPQNDPRVQYFEGDLSQARLGLPEAEVISIFGTADAVIHNGADTSHLKHYADVRASNVGSTAELARLCLPRRMPLHYVSSAGVGIFHAGSATDGFPAGPVNVIPGTEPDGSFGYGCSKWVCEMLLERVSAIHGLYVVIHRPSTIVREGDDAVGPEAQKDWVNAFLLYVRKLKAAPKMKRGAGVLDLVHSQTVCGGVLRHLFSSEEERKAGVTYVNAVGDEIIPLDMLSDLGLREYGEKYAELTYEEWVAAAVAAGLHPGVALLVEGMVGRSGEYPKLSRGEQTRRLDRMV